MTTDYRTPIDVANRALQHCGVTRITTFADNSKNASEVAFVYDKLRRAELRRNVWRYAKRWVALRPVDTNTMGFTAVAFDATKTYLRGSLVTDNGSLYFCNTDTPVAQTPSDHPEYWTLYFGPLTASLRDATNTAGYYAGEIVYTTDPDTPLVYLSLENNNSDDPSTIPAWDTTVMYNSGDTVTYAAATWQSVKDLNLAQIPGATDNWVAIPATEAFHRSGRKWLALTGITLSKPVFIFPIGTGPASSESTRQVYRLPAGYLRTAPQDPRNSRAASDWVFEGNYLITSDTQVILFCFIADVADVLAMDPMFCEGLAARIGFEVCEVLTQSSDKLKNIGAQYKTFMSEARMVNAIENGPIEPDEDAYISCRR